MRQFWVTLLCICLGHGAQAQEGLISPKAARTEPWLGMNLAALRDYQPQRPVIDVMKNARVWFGHLPGQWGGWDEADLRAAGALDDHGWPLFVPDAITGISTVLLVDLPEGASGLAGNYRLRHEGEGRLEISGRIGGQRRRGRSEIWFSYSPGPGLVHLTITQTNRDDPIRNIEIVHEDHIAAHDAGALFNPDWLARIDGMAVLRFMNFMRTNHATIAQWDDRPKIEDYVWTTNGLPLEALIRLANETGIEPWFNIPHLADDEFITRMAQMIREDLDPDLRAWIEFSNETWNYDFPQARAAAAAAEARWGDSNLWQAWNAMRATQMVQIFDQVFEGQEHRLHRVLATQTGWLGLEDQLEARRWRAEDPANPFPPDLFDAYGITGYFSAGLGSDPKAALTRQWLNDARADAEIAGTAQGLSGDRLEAFIRAESHAMLTPKLIEELLDGRHSGDDTDTLSQFFRVTLPYHMDVAERWGLELVAYEGGTHLVGVGPLTDDDLLTDLFIDVNFSDGMGHAYSRLLEGWFAAGAGQFVHYSDITTPTRWGSFGVLRHLDDHNPRWQALVGFDPEAVAR